LLTATQLAAAEPNLARGFAGGLLVQEDGVVYPPAVALTLARRAQELGTRMLLGQTVSAIGDGYLALADGTEVRARRIVLALGADSVHLSPDLPIRKRKGHLVITDRYPGFVNHQLVELGYLKSAHSSTSDSVAFNVQPRQTGQLLIGSSRQFGADYPEVDQHILSAMLARAGKYLPTVAKLSAIRVWTGFRAATPDKLPLIGPDSKNPSLLLATGHEGLGITTSLATAELIADMLTSQRSVIPVDPYLPARYAKAQATDSNHTYEDNDEMDRSHAGINHGI
jgi:glycine/D-amino acid oxidase-like deaminating enzyme